VRRRKMEAQDARSDSLTLESTRVTDPKGKGLDEGGGGSPKSQDPRPTYTLPTTPELAAALRDVWKTGGWPLAALFVVALIGVILVGAGLVQQATQTILSIAIFLAVASFLTFLVLTVLGFLRWKAELTAHNEIYRIETELQDKFILRLFQYAAEVGGPDISPEGRKKEIQTLTDAVGQLIREATKARNELRSLPQSPEEASE
jgi:hypothetical protein